MEISLLDGSKQELPDGSGVIDLSRKIKKSLNGSPLVAKINGEIKELDTILRNNDEVQILTFEDKEGKEIFWHSSAHLLAQAVGRLFPEARPTIGPPIEEGFYYDFANLNISETDFPKIEEEMAKIIKERPQFKRIEYSTREEALEVFGDNPFKKEMIDQLGEGLSALPAG